MARLFPRLASPSLPKNEKCLQLDIVAVLDLPTHFPVSYEQ